MAGSRCAREARQANKCLLGIKAFSRTMQSRSKLEIGCSVQLVCIDPVLKFLGIWMTVSALSSSISPFPGISSAGVFSLNVAAALTANYQPMWRHESPAYVASEPSSSSMRNNLVVLGQALRPGHHASKLEK